MITAKITVQGLRECEAGLDELPVATAKNVVRRALQKAAAVLVEDARQRVVRNTGATAAGLQVSSRLTKRQKRGRERAGAVEIFAGVGGKRRGSTAHLIEFGSAHSAPQPFLRPAAGATAGRMRLTFLGELRAELEKAKARMRRKAARALAAARKG